MRVQNDDLHKQEAAPLKETALFILPPVTAFYLMQFVYGANPWEMELFAALGNILCIGAVYFLLCAVTGYPAACCIAVHALCGVWGAVNYFVSVYRGTPVLPWDLTALGTAFAVSGTYSFFPTWRMAAGILFLGGLCWALRKQILTGRFLPDFRNAFFRGAVLAAGVLCLMPVLEPERLTAFGIEPDVWNQTEAYKNGGVVGVFLRNTEFMEVEKPENMTAERAKEILDGTKREPLPEISAGRPNIVAIMNESWADFEEFGNLSLTDAVRGHAYTSVFGAGTSASEFEFLTGNSMAFLPSGSIPYQQYILGDSPSMASILKENGYRTLAFHPGERTSWQRNLAYPRLGFDAFLCGEDMNVTATEEHGYISDASDFRQIIWEFENKEPGDPLFLFNVTIQNHGSYTAKDYPAEVQLADKPGRYPMAEQYLTLANKTDEALRLLIDYFSGYDEPVLLVMFGDHQPSVEQEFLDEAYGVRQEDMTMEQYMGKFRVPFLWEFQKELLAMTFVGYMDREGNAYSHLETNGFSERIEEYRGVQYERVFGDSYNEN